MSKMAKCCDCARSDSCPILAGAFMAHYVNDAKNVLENAPLSPDDQEDKDLRLNIALMSNALSFSIMQGIITDVLIKHLHLLVPTDALHSFAQRIGSAVAGQTASIITYIWLACLGKLQMVKRADFIAFTQDMDTERAFAIIRKLTEDVERFDNEE